MHVASPSLVVDVRRGTDAPTGEVGWHDRARLPPVRFGARRQSEFSSFQVNQSSHWSLPSARRISAQNQPSTSTDLTTAGHHLLAPSVSASAAASTSTSIRSPSRGHTQSGGGVGARPLGPPSSASTKGSSCSLLPSLGALASSVRALPVGAAAGAVTDDMPPARRWLLTSLTSLLLLTSLIRAPLSVSLAVSLLPMLPVQHDDDDATADALPSALAAGWSSCRLRRRGYHHEHCHVSPQLEQLSMPSFASCARTGPRHRVVMHAGWSRVAGSAPPFTAAAMRMSPMVVKAPSGCCAAREAFVGAAGAAGTGAHRRGCFCGSSGGLIGGAFGERGLAGGAIGFLHLLLPFSCIGETMECPRGSGGRGALAPGVPASMRSPTVIREYVVSSCCNQSASARCFSLSNVSLMRTGAFASYRRELANSMIAARSAWPSWRAR